MSGSKRTPISENKPRARFGSGHSDRNSRSPNPQRSAALKQAASSRRLPGHQQNARRTQHRRGMPSYAEKQATLAQQGSYAKYFKSILKSPFEVKLRCNCGRSRNMAWMFLCTFCATGTKVEKQVSQKKSNSKPFSANFVSSVNVKFFADSDDDDIKNMNTNEDEDLCVQRPFLCCDLCAHKLTESYYCPHCLSAFPAHYVKLRTRCTRCVSCPVCTSPLEKIVYSGSSSNTSLSISKTKSDVYLYQCPFCFWSSNAVGLEAGKSDALLSNLNDTIKKPLEKKRVYMNDIKKLYQNMNEKLRQEEDRIEKSKRFHGYRGGKMKKKKRFGKYFKKGNTQSRLALPGKHIESVGPLDENIVQKHKKNDAGHNALDDMNNELLKKFNDNHLISKEIITMAEPPLDQSYVTAFHLRNVAPLQHRLSDPLHQSIALSAYIPQRFHLMTKEAYKCPHEMCGKYVCKPVLRGSQAIYDKRTAVLDYLPKINLQLVSGGLLTTAESVLLVFVQNRHLEKATFVLDASVNENDTYSTAKIHCSNEEFTMDEADIHIKGDTQMEIVRENGDFIKGKEAGVHFRVKPHEWMEDDVKFSVQMNFTTMLTVKEASSSKSTRPKAEDLKTKKVFTAQKCSLSFILDINLGPPRKPGMSPAKNVMQTKNTSPVRKSSNLSIGDASRETSDDIISRSSTN